MLHSQTFHSAESLVEQRFVSNMNFKSVVVVALAIIFEINAEKYSASDFAVKKDCTETHSIRTQQYVPYEEIFEFNDGYAIGKSKNRIKYKYENIEINQTKEICCDGYQNYDDKRCIPVCTKSCGFEGICSSPENCICNEGYSFDLNSKKCKPICSPQCINGFCLSPDLCSCHEGYRMTNDNDTCEPICENQTDSCTYLEFCAEPGVCSCIQGYARDSLDRKLGTDVLESCKPICDRICINGECILPNICKCHENYTAVDQFACEHVYLAPNFIIQKNCSETKTVKRKVQIPYQETYVVDDDTSSYEDDYDYGDLLQFGIRTVYKTEYKIVNETTSICCDGYQNYDEQNCLPVCSKNCGLHGICSEPDICICNEGYSMDHLGNCEPVCQFECMNGQCTSPNYCTCNEGYHKFSDDYICEKF